MHLSSQQSMENITRITLFFNKILFFGPRLDILIFWPILGPKILL